MHNNLATQTTSIALVFDDERHLENWFLQYRNQIFHGREVIAVEAYKKQLRELLGVKE